MGRVNEGGMHFIHHGKGIEKQEFELCGVNTSAF